MTCPAWKEEYLRLLARGRLQVQGGQGGVEPLAVVHVWGHAMGMSLGCCGDCLCLGLCLAGCLWQAMQGFWRRGQGPLWQLMRHINGACLLQSQDW